jgi:multidrug efflux pump subunit AcrA (membrane-fusion protein)
MIRKRGSLVLGTAAIAALCSTACNGDKTSAATLPEPTAVAVHAVTLQNQPVDRFLRVTGSLMADEHADVAAETAGRVIATPIERGTRVTTGTVLVRISGTEADAQLREAQANAAQIEARLGLSASQPFDPIHVPEVMNAKASLDWAEAEFRRSCRRASTTSVPRRCRRHVSSILRRRTARSSPTDR